MKTNNQSSLRSPKNKFSVQVCFDTPLEGVGSVITMTANTMSDAEHLAQFECAGIPAHVTVKEKKEYPEFDWVVVNEYNLNK